MRYYAIKMREYEYISRFLFYSYKSSLGKVLENTVNIRGIE